MDIAKKGKIHYFCIPNAILTFQEYLEDYASPQTKEIGEKVIQEHLSSLKDGIKPKVEEYLQRIKKGERDLRV